MIFFIKYLLCFVFILNCNEFVTCDVWSRLRDRAVDKFKENVNEEKILKLVGAKTSEEERNDSPPIIQPQQQSIVETTAEPCLETETTVRGHPPVCKGQLIFEDNFDTLDTFKWNRNIQIPLDTEGAEFVSFQNNPENCYVNDGKLFIVPKLQTDFLGFDEDRLRTGELNLHPRCTGIFNPIYECTRRAGGQFILPPVVSCKLNTKSSFVFKYGKIEIRAKFPKGDWLFPQLSVEPLEHAYGTNNYISGQMRVGFIRGNEMLESRDDVQIDGFRLYGGLILTPQERLKDVWMKSVLSDSHFGDDFHNYTLTWTPDRISVGVDGNIYGNYRADFRNHPLAGEILHASTWNQGGFMAPFDRDFYLSLGVAAGGLSEFPDFSVNGLSRTLKPWNNTSPKSELNFWLNRNNWYPTWRSLDAAMQIDYVKVWAL